MRGWSPLVQRGLAPWLKLCARWRWGRWRLRVAQLDAFHGTCNIAKHT